MPSIPGILMSLTMTSNERPCTNFAASAHIRISVDEEHRSFEAAIGLFSGVRICFRAHGHNTRPRPGPQGAAGGSTRELHRLSLGQRGDHGNYNGRPRM